MAEVVLEISDLRFSYEDGEVLSGLSMTLEEGELLALVGENGAGKSTLMELVLGRVMPQSGSLRLFGDDISRDAHHADVAYVSQDALRGYRHFPTTIEELLRVHCRFLGVDADVGELLARVGLEGHQRRRLGELSGGQLQRVGLLVALLKDARLILLDEPTTGIDQRFSEELYRLLRGMANEGKSVILVTHHLSEAAGYVDRALRLARGRLEELPRDLWQGGAR